MLDDASLNQIRQQLDNELANADPNIGVAFGIELFREFGRRGWITLQPFGVAGTSLLGMNVPAYSKRHFAWARWDFEDYQYQVGKRGA